MSVTTQAQTKPSTKRANKTAETASPATAAEAAIALPPKLRRRPLLVVASIAAVCLGALLGVWAYTSVTTAEEVVAVRSTVPRGALISRENLVTVRIGVDPALKPIPAAQLEGVVGQRAAMDLPAGGLVTQASITATVVPAEDMSVVGVAVPAALLPGEPLRSGDQVRVVATPVSRVRSLTASSGPSPPPLLGSTRPPTAGRRWSASRCPTTRPQSWLPVPPPARSPWCWIVGSADEMAVIVLASAAGSPGVTTSASGLALTWPRPVLLIEADPTGGSAMLAGFFRGTTAHTAGLIDLAWAHREGLLIEALAELPMPIPDSSASLLPGIRAHTQAGSLTTLWEPLVPDELAASLKVTAATDVD
jgi:flagella basal body P-ring formation protein FlgA